MKNCKSCGRSASDDALFCSSCGCDEFVADTANGASQDTRFDFTPTEIKGKVKAWQIIVIALGCIALIAAGIFAVKNVLSAKSYTAGEVVEGVYVNEWAELQFAIDDGFVDHTDDQGHFYEDEQSDIGFVVWKEENNCNATLSFQHIGNTNGYTEHEGMNDYLEGYGDEIKEECGITPTISEYFKYSIAGEDYTTAKVGISQFGVEYHCIRYEGEYAIIIYVCADDDETAKSILSKFQHYEAE
ncbi:MAG: hypothetical protein IIX67_00220 [Clostridia bacterium]|nr:hypothetical protein [Clostridia bacterium]